VDPVGVEVEHLEFVMALARNQVLAFKLGVATTGVPDFFTATRLLGWAWFFSISSRFCASAWRSREPAPAAFPGPGCESARSWLVGLCPMADEIELPVSGILGMGAEIAGSAASARMGDWAAVCEGI